MRVTTWGEYGMLVCVHLARQGDGTPLPARSLARDERLPPDYVEQILLRLRRAGLVRSVRGARGGYVLARPGAEITARDVLMACELATFQVACDRHPVGGPHCEPGAVCTVRPVWRLLEQRIDDLLSSVTLADLLQDEAHVYRVARA